MKTMQRREFIKTSAVAASTAIAAPAYVKNLVTDSPNERINVALVGISGKRKPVRGMTQARVEESFGAPSSRMEPVGDPPITRWEYASFVVFFEYDRVIHAVSKR